MQRRVVTADTSILMNFCIDGQGVQLTAVEPAVAFASAAGFCSVYPLSNER